MASQWLLTITAEAEVIPGPAVERDDDEGTDGGDSE